MLPKFDAKQVGLKDFSSEAQMKLFFLEFMSRDFVIFGAVLLLIYYMFNLILLKLRVVFSW